MATHAEFNANTTGDEVARAFASQAKRRTCLLMLTLLCMEIESES